MESVVFVSFCLFEFLVEMLQSHVLVLRHEESERNHMHSCVRANLLDPLICHVLVPHVHADSRGLNGVAAVIVESDLRWMKHTVCYDWKNGFELKCTTHTGLNKKGFINQSHSERWRRYV